jgi:hypothetical protein
MNNPLFGFLAELMSRLFHKNPKFFKVLQVISLVVGAAAALAMYLQSQGVALPKLFELVGNINVFVSSVVALIMAQLPNAPKPTDETPADQK